MRTLAILLLAALSLLACSDDPSDGTSGTSGTAYTTYGAPSITGANYTNYRVSLEAHDYRIFKIPDYKESLLITDSSWWHDAVVYQVFVRSFMDSDGDGKGDFNGLASKLQYLKDLGVTAVWTLPIQDNTPASYHGYHITNYYKTEDDYGTMTDFENLVSSVHGNNMKIIIDWVINHSGGKHPWVTSNPEYYVVSNVMPSGWGYPWGGGSSADVWKEETTGKWYYTSFGTSDLYDFNFNDPAVRSNAKHQAQFWLAKNIDGFRFDAVRYIYENGPGAVSDQTNTLAWWREYQTYLKGIKPDVLTVGEAWSGYTDIAKYYDSGDGMNQCFNFDFYYALASYNAANIRNVVNNKPAEAPWGFFAPFTDNHDNLNNNYRTADLYGKMTNILRQIAAIQMTFPGTPYIYYGTEIGMGARNAGNGSDLEKRTPMHWDSSSGGGFTSGTPWQSLADNSAPWNVSDQQADPDSVLNTYKALIALRRSESALRRGNIRIVPSDSDSSVLAYIRTGPDGSFLVVANMSGSATIAGLDFSSLGISATTNYAVSQISLPGSATNVITETISGSLAFGAGFTDRTATYGYWTIPLGASGTLTADFTTSGTMNSVSFYYGYSGWQLQNTDTSAPWTGSVTPLYAGWNFFQCTGQTAAGSAHTPEVQAAWVYVTNYVDPVNEGGGSYTFQVKPSDLGADGTIHNIYIGSVQTGWGNAVGNSAYRLVNMGSGIYGRTLSGFSPGDEYKFIVDFDNDGVADNDEWFNSPANYAVIPGGNSRIP